MIKKRLQYTALIILVIAVFLFFRESLLLKDYFIKRDAISNYKEQVKDFAAFPKFTNDHLFYEAGIAEDSLLQMAVSNQDNMVGYSNAVELVPFDSLGSKYFFNSNEELFVVEKKDTAKVEKWEVYVDRSKIVNKKFEQFFNAGFSNIITGMKQLNCKYFYGKKDDFYLAFNKGIYKKAVML